jgi:orotidine-5'-phosphate decarboxylase
MPKEVLAEEPIVAVDHEPRLFVALDGMREQHVSELEQLLGSDVAYKVGLELVMATGFDLAQKLKENGRIVFLDMKLHDIGATVEKATAAIAVRNFDYLTVHATDRKTLDAAFRGRRDVRVNLGKTNLKLLAVTVLTNLDAADLAEQGITGMSAAELVVHRARMAKAVGFDGCIASGQEAARVRAAVGPDFLIVTPGIRPAGAKTDDQARVTTPLQAIQSGATHLVVGRPITAAADPRAAAASIIAEIQAAQNSIKPSEEPFHA